MATVSVDKAIRWSNLSNLIEAFHRQALQVERVKRLGDSAEVSLFIPLAHDHIETDARAKCRAVLTADFITDLPKVYCEEYWLKKDADWHVNGDGSLCYELDARWSHKMKAFYDRFSLVEVVNIAAFWSVHHVKSLLYRHLLGYENGLSRWPKEWEAFRHGERGREDFERELLSLRLRCSK